MNNSIILDNNLRPTIARCRVGSCHRGEIVNHSLHGLCMVISLAKDGNWYLVKLENGNVYHIDEILTNEIVDKTITEIRFKPL